MKCIKASPELLEETYGELVDRMAGMNAVDVIRIIAPTLYERSNGDPEVMRQSLCRFATHVEAVGEPEDIFSGFSDVCERGGYTTREAEELTILWGFVCTVKMRVEAMRKKGLACSEAR